MEPKISIVVPVYNLEQYIERTVSSILKQTYQNIEIILVDDGSRDNSWSVMQRIALKDKRVLPIHQENGGVTSARLNGVRHAQGEWIGFVDGDDEVEPDMYEVLLHNAFKYNAQISHCGYQMVFGDGRVHYFHNSGKVIQQDQTTGVRDLLEGVLVEPGLWNKLYHRNLFDILYKLMPADIKINEDLLMNFFLFSQAECAVFEDCCKYHYIVRSNSASRGEMNEHRIYDPIRVKEIILEQVNTENMQDAQKAYIMTCVYTYCGLKGKKYRDARKWVRQKISGASDWIRWLPTRGKILAEMIVYMPGVFGICYPLYERFLQGKKYD